MIWLISTCKVFHNKTGSQETTYSNRFQPLSKHTCILFIALFSHSIIELNSVLFFSFIQALIDKTNNLKSYSWIFVKSTPYNHWMLTQNDSKNTHQHQWKTILNQNRLSPSQTLFFFLLLLADWWTRKWVWAHLLQYPSRQLRTTELQRSCICISNISCHFFVYSLLATMPNIPQQTWGEGNSEGALT